MRASMNRISSDPQVQRDTAYYKENIVKVTSVDEFMDDYRLYSYAMKAYGLEDMTYAKAFMKQVLESDLTDSSSFANRLSDSRYRDFAIAYQASAQSKTLMSSAQTDAMIEDYGDYSDRLEETIGSETRYYKVMNDSQYVQNVDQFIANSRLRDYTLEAYGLNPSTFDNTFLRELLVSSPADTDTQLQNYITTAQDKIDAAQAKLSPVVERDTFISIRDAYISQRDTYSSLQTTLSDLQTARNETGADVHQIDLDIAEAKKSLDSTVYNFVSNKTTELKYQIDLLTAQQQEPGADTAALQAQIDPLQAEFDKWDADKTTLTSLNDLKSQLYDWQAALTEPGADTTYINQQIDDLNTQISADSDALNYTPDLTTINTAISDTQAIIDSYDSLNLPAPGAESTAFKAEQNAIIQTQQAAITSVNAFVAIVEDFEFNSDGTVPAGGYLSDANLNDITEAYAYKQDRLTKTGATLNTEFFAETVNNYTTAREMLYGADGDRIFDYLKTAFGITDGVVVKSMLLNAITSDPDDENSYLNTEYKGKANYDGLVALSRAFNFNHDEDGTLPSGAVAMSNENIRITNSRYFSAYDDKYEAQDALDVKKFNIALNAYDGGLKGLLDGSDANGKFIYEFALKAAGLDADEVSRYKMQRVLTSDLNDPRSYANRLGDDRYIQFAKFFNIDEDGNVTSPMQAQSQSSIISLSKKYIIAQTAFAEAEQADAVRAKADTEAEYYQDEILKVETMDDFLKNDRLVNFALIASGIDPENVTSDFMKKIFQSDLSDPDSFANQQSDYRFAELAATFNFDENGHVTRSQDVGGVQTSGDLLKTVNLYYRQSIEEEAGEDSAGVRLALYFEREAPSIKSAYDILGDTALLEVFKTTFSLPDSFSSQDIEKQAELVEKYLNLEDLRDEDKLSSLIQKFTALYDLENSSTDSVVSILSGSSSGLSADTLYSLSQLKLR
ncbi:DUF1217 domain-containing protein [Rhizobium sp. L1K21]|uniref:DUF1217 domain-containing protein n=1 Tax=Rhizobium sp. L1K21 TaxID=2954933 RepID=UPI002091F064|nr:DUF1217 domain-containing protein [Rhizobium sp. L1K21]MCO6186899.1 DUF1217 domain-containing protein [Rhizobium sp. L1K21]